MFGRLSVLVLVGLVTIGSSGSAWAQSSLWIPAPVGMAGNPAAALVLKANDAFAQGDLETAQRDYHAALKRKPDFAIAWFNLGLVDAHLQREAQGLQEMSRGIALAQEHGMNADFIARLKSLRDGFAHRASGVAYG